MVLQAGDFTPLSLKGIWRVLQSDLHSQTACQRRRAGEGGREGVKAEGARHAPVFSVNTALKMGLLYSTD